MALKRRLPLQPLILIFMVLCGLCLAACTGSRSTPDHAAVAQFPLAENADSESSPPATGPGQAGTSVTPDALSQGGNASPQSQPQKRTKPTVRMAHATDPDAAMDEDTDVKRRPPRTRPNTSDTADIPDIAKASSSPDAAAPSEAKGQNSPDAPPVSGKTVLRSEPEADRPVEHKPVGHPLPASGAATATQSAPMPGAEDPARSSARSDLSISPESGKISQSQAQLMEPEQRAALVTLLKKLNRKKSFYVPLLDAGEKAAIGPYAEAYDCLRSFARQEALLKPFMTAEELEATLLGDPKNEAHYGMLLEESRRVRRLQTELANFYRRAVAEKDVLKLPYKIRPVYDEVFGKKVLEPVTRLLKIAPYVEEELRLVARAALVHGNAPQRPDTAETLKQFLLRYKEPADDGNALLREVRGEEQP